MAGAGAAGLAAGWRLACAGHEVVVYDRRAWAGGLLCTAERAGVRADQAVQLVSSTYRELFRLADEVGAAELLVETSRDDALWRHGRVHGIRYGSASSMAASSALPTLLKFKLATKYVPWLKTRGARLDVNDLPGTAATEDRESIASWGARELGEDFVEYLTYPLLAAYYGSPPEEASAALYHALAREGLNVRLYALRGGAGEFAARVAAAITNAGGRVQPGVEVHAVLADEHGVRVQTSAGEQRFDRAVVATPPQQAAAMLESHEATRSWLAAVRTRPAVSLTLWLERRVPVDWFGLSYPRVESPGEVLVAVCVQSRKLEFGADVKGDAVVLFPSPEFLDTDPSDDVLTTTLTRAAETGLPGIGRVVLDSQVLRMEGGYRKFPAGYIRRLVQEPVPLPAHVALAGDYLVAPTVEGAVRSGLRAADALLRAGGGA